MKKYYYFSKNKLKFVEIRNYYRKFLFLIAFVSALFSFFVFGAYFIISEILNPNAEVKELQVENQDLKLKLSELLTTFQGFENQLDSLSDVNNDLRLVSNLESITAEQRNIGVGGNIFEDINPTNSGDLNEIISDLNKYVDNINLKLKFEKNNYNEIEKAFEYNSRLYDAIPALKPSEGRYGDRFGIRYHPILKIRRMHNGVDVLSKTGTEVFAPGNGRVTFLGRKGGFGKTIEIDHGFGYKTLYGHLSRYKVKKGQRVKRGDLIALTGGSGSLSTGPHLHYEVRHNGIALNPKNFIFDDVKIFEINSDQK